MDSVLEHKKEIRTYMKDFRKSLSESEFTNKSILVFSKLIQSDYYNQANVILTYVSFKNETDTIRLIDYSLNIGKKVAVPKIINNIMDFYYINSLDELSRGFFGVMEPVDTTRKYSYVENSNDIIIVPGLAFDMDKSRLGYGGGYYDNYLKDKSITKAAICFKEQIIEHVPSQAHDIKMDIIITD